MAWLPFLNKKNKPNSTEKEYIYFVGYNASGRNYNTIVTARMRLLTLDDIRYLEKKLSQSLQEEQKLDSPILVVIVAFSLLN